jgi:NAD-dependent dihydropyrimidine dehydrogenase PreA subunit
MAYVIAEPCIGTKDTACVDACPVDCIHPRKNEDDYATETQLYIDPVECIDCGACVPVAPGAVAQESEAKPLPSTPPDDTDWTYYCDPSHKVEPIDQLKCIGGKTDSKRQISISGEVRMRGEYFDHIGLGESSPSSGYLLQRYILNTDVVLGDRVRLFTSLESGLEDGRVGGPLAPLPPVQFEHGR